MEFNEKEFFDELREGIFDALGERVMELGLYTTPCLSENFNIALNEFNDFYLGLLDGAENPEIYHLKMMHKDTYFIFYSFANCDYWNEIQQKIEDNPEKPSKDSMPRDISENSLWVSGEEIACGIRKIKHFGKFQLNFCHKKDLEVNSVKFEQLNEAGYSSDKSPEYKTFSYASVHDAIEVVKKFGMISPYSEILQNAYSLYNERKEPVIKNKKFEFNYNETRILLEIKASHEKASQMAQRIINGQIEGKGGDKINSKIWDEVMNKNVSRETSDSVKNKKNKIVKALDSIRANRPKMGEVKFKKRRDQLQQQLYNLLNLKQKEDKEIFDKEVLLGSCDISIGAEDIKAKSMYLPSLSEFINKWISESPFEVAQGVFDVSFPSDTPILSRGSLSKKRVIPDDEFWQPGIVSASGFMLNSSIERKTNGSRCLIRKIFEDVETKKLLFRIENCHGYNYHNIKYLTEHFNLCEV